MFFYMEGEYMKFLDEDKVNKILLGVIILLQIITISVVVLCSDCYKNEDKDSNDDVKVLSEDISIVTNEEKVVKKISVDVKGAVVNPGVYELDNEDRVIDAIELAGGVKSNASTKYLNLSKTLSDEMIIYVYTNNQIKNMNVKEDIKEECNCSTIDTSSCAGSNIIISSNEDNSTNGNQESADKVSLNNASKEELMTLSGVGESKALAIIEYRSNNGGFKVIEDIMNVSGIGESLYNKIKDYITL